jgi:hypothetical protein
MKIFVAHSSKFQYETKLYAPLRASELAKTNEFIFPHAHGAIWNTKHDVSHAGVVVAEVSLPSTGVGMELGWADSANVPIILIHEQGISEPPFTKYVTSTVIEYSSGDDLVAKLQRALKQVV